MNNVHPIRDKFPENEKITINLGYVDLGRVDLLVQEGSTPTAAILSARRSATSWMPNPTRCQKPSSGIRWNWGCGIIRWPTWRRCGLQMKSCTSKWLGLPASPAM